MWLKRFRFGGQAPYAGAMASKQDDSAKSAAGAAVENETIDTPYVNPKRPRRPKQHITARGRDLLSQAIYNRGTAFTHEERKELGLIGLLPGGEQTLEMHARRVYAQFQDQPTDLSKHVFMLTLLDRNETLFYRVLADHLEEMLPIIYTPTIGESIQTFSHWFTRPRGLYLSIDHPDEIEESFDNYGLTAEDVDLLVVTDSEGILGIGDQGVGGVQITIGKLAVYTAAAGVHPRRAIPVVLDTGTDNLGLLNDEVYLGNRHARVRGKAYDDFLDRFVETVARRYPHAMLHWEDFGAANAHRVLERYRDTVCSFNDDIQGTAAVVLAAALSAAEAAGTPMRDQRIVVHGAGTAGIGIAELMRDRMVREGLSLEEANARFWCLGSRGLISERLGNKMRDFQRPFARSADELEGWTTVRSERIDLLDVVRNVRPTMLIGTSAQAGTFTEEVVREMGAHVDSPIIFPLSNPTSKAEAVPADILTWTEGRALIATGSPFAPVAFGDTTYTIAQANNALVFPGLGLGATVCRPTAITDNMIVAAAEAVAGIQSGYVRGQSLLPSVNALRMVSGAVAGAVAEAAEKDGVARVPLTNPVQQVFELMWQPIYRPVSAD